MTSKLVLRVLIRLVKGGGLGALPRLAGAVAALAAQPTPGWREAAPPRAVQQTLGSLGVEEVPPQGLDEGIELLPSAARAPPCSEAFLSPSRRAGSCTG